MAIKPEITATAEDFSFSDHVPDWLVIGGTAEIIVRVCRVCGKPDIEPVPAERIGNYQDPFPRFGADEYLSW